MANNPPIAVQAFGQSIWLDYIHRRDIENGELQRRIDEDGVLGVTSNPSIFQQAIGESDVYDKSIATMLDLEPGDIYEALAIHDIQAVADLLRPIYDRTAGRDGYVSLEVSPLLARDSAGTLAEAQRLFTTVDRPNLLIKIPATHAGIAAIEDATAAGININVTLLFGADQYEQVANAYIRGLERRLEAGEAVDNIASVASFFLGRIDVMVDNVLENNIRAAQVHGDPLRITANRQLLGQAAIASARVAYQRFQHLFHSERFQRLQAAGARVQRPLWASTGHKNPAYKDTMYPDNLTAPDTISTLPPDTLNAFLDHGTAAEALVHRDEEQFLDPEQVFSRLSELGIDIGQVADRLQVDGVDAFIESFEMLIDQVAAKRTILSTGILSRQLLALGIYADEVNHAIRELDASYAVQRIWARDGSLWKNHGPTMERIRQRLGWLKVLEAVDLERLQRLQASIRDGDFESAVLLGMGGSSLAPEVLYETFGHQQGFPRFIVLDNTNPARIHDVEASINIDKTLFIVSTKSGDTVETLALYRYFFNKTGENGQQFIAITDPASRLEAIAHEKQFRDTFLNPPDMIGRYAALSYFGMVPAAIMGLDLERLWENAQRMMAACGSTIPGPAHPGVTLGAILGALGQQGRNKVCIFCSKSIAAFGSWAEQLIAESLGKQGQDLIPVVGATVGKPHDYATDRLFVYLRVDDDPDIAAMDAAVKMLREAGHPRITQRLPDPYAIAGEFFRWQYAIAVAGVLMKVNPFDEPNVDEAKEATSQLLETYQELGYLPTDEPAMVRDNIQLYTNSATIEPLRELSRAHGYDADSLIEVLSAQLAASNAGDYFAVLAYLDPKPEIDDDLRTIQRRLRHVTRRAVTIGYGPRYLHSTGQLHKGGANNGIFFLITADQAEDIDIPGAPYSFGTLFKAQALGDINAMHSRNRRIFRLHITGNVRDGLRKLMAAIEFVEERRQ